MRDDYNTAATDSYAEVDFADRPQEGFSPAVILRLLRGRWHWAVLLGLLLAAGGGYLGYQFEGPKYEARSGVTINPSYGVAVEVTDLELYEPYWNMVRTEIERLEAVDTAELAMQQPEWQEAINSTGEIFASMTPEDFVESLEFQPPYQNQRTVKIAFMSEEPVIAQAGLNALLDAYRLLRKQDQNADISENLTLLQEQRRDLELRERQIREQMRLIIPDSEYLTIKRRLSAKLGELANMEFNLGELELVLGPFLDPEGAATQLTVKDLMMRDPEMIDLLDQKKALEEEYVYQTVVLRRGETMRNVQLIKRMITRVDRQILELEESWLARGEDTELPLPDQISGMMSRHKAMVGKIAELQAETNDIATRLSAVEEDEFELLQTRESIRNVQDQIDDFKATSGIINENETVTRIEIGDKAPLPISPANAENQIQFAGAGIVGGMGMGFGLVMLVGLMDRRLQRVSDTTSDLPDAKMLGILPTLPADLKDPDQADVAAHCVHHIRTLLQIGGINRVFSITSPSAGSGKSSLATALGMSFAATGSRTLVIDADLVGAGISRRMGLIVHEALDVVIRRKGLLNEAQLSSAMTKATVSGKLLEQVLLDEKLMSQDQLDVAQRLQRDTSLGLLDACGPRQLAPPARQSSSNDDVLIMLDDPYGSTDQETAYAHHEEPAISMFDNANQSRLMTCVAQTGIENLSILPVGKARPSDASRLSPAAMRELVRQAREAFDIVLIDTGPVLGSLEASIAAAESDATVMIVSRGDHRSVATRSLEQLQSVRAVIAGLVFNHALESDLANSSYASLVSQERRPDMAVRKRKLDKTRSARLGPLGTAVASCSEEISSDESLVVTPNGSSS